MSADSEGDALERELKDYLDRVKSFLRILKDENLNAENEETRKELMQYFNDYYKKVHGGYSDDEDDDGPLYEELPGGGGNISFDHQAITSIDAKVLQNYADMFGWLKKKVNFLVTTRHWVILYEGTLFLYSDHKADKPEREIDVRKGKFTPLKDYWFDLETKEANGNPKVIRLKADEKMYDQWKSKLENAFKMKEKPEQFSSDEDSEDEQQPSVVDPMDVYVDDQPYYYDGENEQHPTNPRNPRRNPQLPEHFSSDESDDGLYVNDSKRGKAPPPQPVRPQQPKSKNNSNKPHPRPPVKPLQPNSDQEEQDYVDVYDEVTPRELESPSNSSARAQSNPYHKRPLPPLPPHRDSARDSSSGPRNVSALYPAGEATPRPNLMVKPKKPIPKPRSPGTPTSDHGSMNASFLHSTKPTPPIKPKNVTKQISNLRQMPAKKMSLGDISSGDELQRKLQARKEKNNMQ